MLDQRQVVSVSKYSPDFDISIKHLELRRELLSNLVFEFFWSCGDLAGFGDFNTVFERDAGDDFGQVVKAA